MERRARHVTPSATDPSDTVYADIADFFGDDVAELASDLFSSERVEVPSAFTRSSAFYRDILAETSERYDDAEATELAFDLCEWLTEKFGGSVLSMPARRRGRLDALESRILAEAFGGTTVTVPRVLKKDSEFTIRLLQTPTACAMGEDERNRVCLRIAEWTADNYSGGVFSVPRDPGKYIARRREKVIRENPDLSANELARRLNITSRWVEKIRKRIRETVE